ncbi:MAG TPA: hypothetical protein VJB02_02480 [Coxiellaceae bacterium]|nr:hypothetical protein [Coxiellaceae bacterium]
MDSSNDSRVLEELDLRQEIQLLLERNTQAIDQYLSSITELREQLETEEARLAFCLYEKRKLLEELKKCEMLEEAA